MDAARPDAMRIFWDVDAPATLAELREHPDHPLHAVLPDLDPVLTYGGGPAGRRRLRSVGRARVRADLQRARSRHASSRAAERRFAGDLAFLGNRLPDRERRVEEFFLSAAEQLPERSFLLGGAGWDDKAMPANVRHIGHV